MINRGGSFKRAASLTEKVGYENHMYKKREYVYLVFIVLIIAGIYQYGIRKICGFVMYPDEFGYWASAAKIVGYDWSELASLGSYYSFGYSILLIPVLKLFTNGVMAYRAAVALNVILACISIFLLWNTINKLFPKLDRVKQAFICGIAVLYPVWIFYMQMTLTEALLMFLFVSIVFLFVSLVQKPGIGKACGLAIALMYTYSVHMRTVSVVIACLITLVLWGLSNPSMRKQMLILLGTIAAAGLIVMFIKRNVLMSVFSKADTDVIAINDYSRQIEKIGEILTFREIYILLKEIVGKIFYLGMASFGIFYWAIGWCIKEITVLIKRIVRKTSRTIKVQQWLALFLVLTVAGEVLICTIFMHGSGKIDCLVYGRYNEFFVPVLLAIGIVAMLQSSWIWSGTLIFGAVSGLMLLPVFSVIEEKNLEGIRGCFIVGISYWLKEEEFNPYYFFGTVWIMGLLMMLLVSVIIWIAKRWENMAWILAFLIIMEVLLGIQASTHYTYKMNEAGFQDLIVAEKIMENWNENMRIVYLDEGTAEFVDFQQMQMPDNPIQVVRGDVRELQEDLGDFLIVSPNSPQKESLERIYNRYIAVNNCILYFNKND